MMRRMVTGAVLAMLAVFVLSELTLPYIVGKQIEAGLAKSYATNDIRASVSARPALSMLGGNFSTVLINGNNLKADKLTISQFSAVFKDTTLDVNKLVNDRVLVLHKVGSFDGTVVLQEQEINQFVSQAVKGFKNIRVTLQPESMKIDGDLSIGPANVAVAMEGKLRGDQTKLKFVADQVYVNNALVGVSFGAVMTELTLFDTKKLPVAATVRDVIVEQGRVVIRIVK